MAETPCCGNCAAWQQTQGVQGECHFAPPQAILMGFRPAALAGQPPQPIIAGVFPAAIASSFCRQWAGDVEPVVTTIGGHASDCAIHNAPAFDPGTCDCDVIKHDHTGTHRPLNDGGTWGCEWCGEPEERFADVKCKGAPHAAA